MAIRSSRFFNRPAMAQAASNLATLFEPPSGTDAAGYARARADDLQTGQRKAMWDYMQRPGFDQTLFDRAGIILAISTTRRRATTPSIPAPPRSATVTTPRPRRRGRHNAADNQRALQVAREQALLQPIGKDETQFRPTSIQDLFDRARTADRRRRRRAG